MSIQHQPANCEADVSARRPAASSEFTAEPLAISPRQTTKALNVGLTTVYSMLGDGRLESVKVGRRRLIKFASVKAVLDAA